jgi:formylglycine-generating enzyme required for sulfatase activity
VRENRASTDVVRFEREARAAGAIESQYIAQVFDAGQDSKTGFPYLVLEYLTGEDVHQLLRRLGPLPMDLALRIVAQTCAGLSKAHEAGVVHRDIKPANIFLTNRDGDDVVCKILDFGVAKFNLDQIAGDDSVDSSDQAGLTQTGTLLGSPLFMSPEQAKGLRDIDTRADLWSLGILLYKMLVGRTPHEKKGVNMGIGELIMSICLNPPALIREVVPSAPAEVEAILEKLLRIDRNERYQTADEVLEEFRRILPGGFSIHKSMLAAVTPDERTSLPPMSAASSNPPLGRLLNNADTPSSTPSSRTPNSSANNSLSQSSGVQQALSGESPIASTLNPHLKVSQSTTVPSPGVDPAPPKPKNRLGIVAASALIVAVGGFVAFNKFAKPPEAPPKPAATPVITSAAPSAAVSVAAARPTQCPADMVLVPGGKFFMGSDEENFKLWQPAHRVILDTFCIDKTEVTVADYKVCSAQGECKRPPEKPTWPKTEGTSDEEHENKRTAYAELCNFGKPGHDNHPMNCVSWSHAVEHCAFRKKRLPTEAEWEYAARGSDGRKFPWGEEADVIDRVNAGGIEFTQWEQKHKVPTSTRLYEVNDKFEGTAPVGSFPKGRTRFGADDFIGNVWEWTSDWFETYKPDEVINPKGAATGDRKAIRGGGFNGGVLTWLSPAFRFHQVPDAITPVIGFRCVMNL